MPLDQYSGTSQKAYSGQKKMCFPDEQYLKGISCNKHEYIAWEIRQISARLVAREMEVLEVTWGLLAGFYSTIGHDAHKYS